MNIVLSLLLLLQLMCSSSLPAPKPTRPTEKEVQESLKKLKDINEKMKSNDEKKLLSAQLKAAEETFSEKAGKAKGDALAATVRVLNIASTLTGLGTGTPATALGVAFSCLSTLLAVVASDGQTQEEMIKGLLEKQLSEQTRKALLRRAKADSFVLGVNQVELKHYKDLVEGWTNSVEKIDKNHHITLMAPYIDAAKGVDIVKELQSFAEEESERAKDAKAVNNIISVISVYSNLLAKKMVIAYEFLSICHIAGECAIVPAAHTISFVDGLLKSATSFLKEMIYEPKPEYAHIAAAFYPEEHRSIDLVMKMLQLNPDTMTKEIKSDKCYRIARLNKDDKDKEIAMVTAAPTPQKPKAVLTVKPETTTKPAQTSSSPAQEEEIEYDFDIDDSDDQTLARTARRMKRNTNTKRSHWYLWARPAVLPDVSTQRHTEFKMALNNWIMPSFLPGAGNVEISLPVGKDTYYVADGTMFTKLQEKGKWMFKKCPNTIEYVLYNTQFKFPAKIGDKLDEVILDKDATGDPCEPGDKAHKFRIVKTTKNTFFIVNSDRPARPVRMQTHLSVTRRMSYTPRAKYPAIQDYHAFWMLEELPDCN